MSSEKKTARIVDISPRQAAKIAGVVYLICVVTGIFANIFVRRSLIVYGDAATTVNNIMANESLFRIGFVTDLIFLTCWLLLPLALYKLLKPVNNIHAVLMVLFALVMVPIMFINNVFQFAALLLLSGADYLTVFETGQLHAQVTLFLNTFRYGWDIGLVFFGLHLFFLGYLVFKSGYIPRILGILLIFAPFGYLIDSFGKFLLPNYDATIAMFTFIGELLFMLWLLFKGTKTPEMKS